MKLDRVVQREMLERLREVYPGFFVPINDLFKDLNARNNLIYLQEHGLVNASVSRTIGGDTNVVSAKITAAGLDFLQEDGGLTAMFNTVTIKFDNDQLRQIIEKRVTNSSLPDDEKAGIIEKLKGFSGEAMKTAITKLIELGVEKAVSDPSFIARFLC